jgi:hypothetical protein
MFPTNSTRQVLHKLVEQMVNLAEHIQGLSNKDEVPERENDQVYLSKLVREEYEITCHIDRYTNVTGGRDSLSIKSQIQIKMFQSHVV